MGFYKLRRMNCKNFNHFHDLQSKLIHCNINHNAGIAKHGQKE